MSVLESLRQRSGLLVAIVGIALLAFVLTGLFERGTMGSNNVVGEIAGKSIEYNAFNSKVQEAIENKKQNLGKASLSEKEADDAVQEVWNRMINDEVMQKEYKKLGIAVTDDELYEVMVVNPHPYFVRYLTDPNTGKINQAFADPSTGEISTTKIKEFTQNMPPEQETQWVQLEDMMRQIRIIEKYNNLVKKGAYVTTSQAKRIFNDKNKAVTFKYVFKGYPTILDNKVTITDEDLNAYYSTHKNDFKQEASRGIEYVSFDITPSATDREEVMEGLQKVVEKFKEEKPFADDSLFVIAESDSRLFDMNFHEKGTLSPQIDSIMFEENPGFVVGPYNENGTLKVSKLMATKKSADSAKIRHILITYQGTGFSPTITRTKKQAKAVADSVLNLLKPKKGKAERFEALVEKLSDDTQKVKPEGKKDDEFYLGKEGDYGWVNANSSIIDVFKNTGLDGKKGDLKIVESRAGYHIIEVLDAKGAVKKVQVATVQRKLEPSNKTMQGIYTKASEFAGKNNTLALFEKAVDEQKLNKRVAEKIKESDKNIPGIEGSRELIRWLYNNEKGDIFEPKDFSGRYIVAVITDIREKGYATLEQVKAEVTENVIREKKSALLIAEFNTAKNGATSAEVIATKMGLNVSLPQSIGFVNRTIPGIGSELAIIGAVSVQKDKTMSSPLVGKTGVLISYVESVSTPLVPKDYNAEKMEALNKLQSRVDFDEVFNALKESANVEEHLVKFY